MDAPSVAPEVQVSPVPEDVRPLPPTVSYDIQSLGKYDVFLNHRGPDVKDTFVAHLNDALCAAGFHPFLDAKSLIKGKHPYNSINEALSGVGLHVAIFSKGYAESKYCLDELHDMLESGKLILPVFYGVEVENLCRPYDGPFAAGLRKHKKRGRHQDVERWETALAKVADLQGFRLAEFNGDEAQLKRRIVLAVQRALPARRLQQVAPHRVGLEESLKVVIKKLNLTGDSVGIIGVFGMGGIGKTTLVREVYNHFAMEKRFEEQSFLKDVRSITDPLDLQKQLVYDLLQGDLQSSEKFSYWFDRFMRRKVLIVVDDIDHRSQFDVLIPHIDKLARGSRILVTSRDQNVLTNIMRGDGHLTAMHEVELMSPHDSYRLFNWHAFYNEKASDGFQDLARKVADACCRLPLALEVIGAFLFDKKRPEDRDCWHQATETLRANGDILNKLKISYDGLSSDESRLMFTDIACFLIGKDEQMAMQIFESCISYTGPQVSFHALMDKSLVTLDSDRRIRMHDLLRDMGRNVVTKQSQIEGQRSHLWDPAMAERVLRKNQGTDTVRGLSVAGAKDGAAWKAETYTRMSELHFLILDHCQVKGDFSTWSKELRWLQWWSLPLSELPPTLSLLNLSVLDLTGSKSFPCKELRMLILKDCTALKELPQTIGKLSRLKNLDVQGCSTLKALPDSMGELMELTQLNLSNCTTLERLPDTICLLSKLQKLWLINCTELEFLPTEFGKLQRLDEFWADATSLSRLPHSFSQLSNLENLHLHKCEEIQELPSMSGLVKLKLFHMGHIGVQTLPEDFGHLQNLVELHLYGCKNLQTLPQSFGLLQLQRLQMNDNPKLEMLPEGFGRLKSLVDLHIGNNSILSLPLSELPLNLSFPCKELRMLILKDCTAIEELPQTIGKLSRLKNLDVQGCSTLKALPDSMGELMELTQLNLSNCTTLERLPDTICLLTKLEKLWLVNCTKLKFLPKEFGKLQRLDEFWADTTSLSRLPHSFSQLSNLEDLHLRKCENIQELPSMSGLVKLKLFHMGHIGVQTLPEDFGHLQNLVDLYLYGCKNLQTLPQSFGLLQLRRLQMNDNPKLEMLPEGFGRLKSLVDLHIVNNSILSLPLSELPLNLSHYSSQRCNVVALWHYSSRRCDATTLWRCNSRQRQTTAHYAMMASSASDGRQRSAALQQWQYDVFLNHRGPDVKDTFVAHLNDALCAAGFHPFLDAKSLIKGKHPYNSINQALSGVGVHVAIFSKGYAESKYCLDELHDMLESGKLILPVFYGVEVEHLCRPYDGPFAAGLRKHKKRGRHQDVERWETALAKVADLQGFRLAEFNGDEAQLKRRIVLAVQRALPARRLQQVAPHRVGLEESLKVVIKKLNLTGDSVRIIGVFGMGGIGKTTLVREVYNHFAMEKRFEEQSFLKDVRSITDPLDLQKQLVYDLLQEDLQSSEKFSYWFDCFMGRKVLIVVDDIDHRSQFDVLIPHIDKLARGSRILVTSRDQNVLTNIMRGDGHLTAMHEVELMSPHDSYRLFNWHAFYNEKASDGFQDLARKVADACCRLPLALEVIGAFLFDKKRPEDRDCWHQATETLRANGDILNKLKISYDGLSSDESRLMFTDIACFLIGKDEQMAMQIFESCISYTGPQVSFHALMDKSLVTLDSDRRIRMHDLLRDMGRNVVTKQSQIEGQRSHLWDPAMAERVLRKNQGTDTVRGLSVAGAKDGAAWKAETYTRMSELHFLILDHCQVKGDFSTWSKELRWLQWWSLPLTELPPTLSLLNLSVLDLTGSKSVTRISPKNSNDEFPCKELRMLILKDCTALEELPQTIGKLSRLKNLDVQGCSTLKALPDSVGELLELTQLNLSNCTTLEKLPDTICLLSKLEKLWLINCTELEFLPTEFGKLQRLDEFWADATSLSRLPHSFSQLSNLEDLHLCYCENIQELPSMSGLFPCKALRMLIFKDCTALEELPQTIGKLSRLKNLDVQGCSTLKALPDSVGELLELTQLNLSNCTTLEKLPDTICLLSKLEKLWLINCTELEFLPTEFGKLQRLDEFWADATSLSRLPHSFSQLSNLEDLHLCYCENIQELPSMSGLFPCKELRMLILKDCTALEELPQTIGKLSRLKNLDVQGCSTLKALPDSFPCKELRMLILKDCTALEELPQTIGKLSRLKNLDVQGCSTLKALPDSVGELLELMQLNLSNCTTLNRLPHTICRLSKLQKLWLINCRELKFLPTEFGKLQRLDEFWADATSLSRLPHSFSQLSNLEDLHLCYCENIQELPSMSGLFPCKELRMLILKDCTALEELPQTIGKLSRLKNLDVQGCSTLKALPDSMGELLELTQLNLSNCTTLNRLPHTICRLSKLQKLWLINCTKLKFLPTEFGKLQRLDEFWADATSLSRLPHSFSQLSNLEDLHLCYCENIQELPSMSGLFPCKELRMLILKDCTALEELPQTIGKLSRLKNLDVQGCSTLKALPNSVGELLELTQLNLSNCTSLNRLPDTICLLSKLEKLWLINCIELEFLPTEFGKLQRLDEFWADATSLSRLPHSFSQLSNLENLHLHKCEEIQELPSMSGLVKLKLFHMGHIGVQTLPEDFGQLQNLVELHLYGCKNLETLPQSFGLLQLQRLEMYDNPELEMPPEGFGKPKKRKHDSLFIKLKSSSGRFKQRNVDVPSTFLELGTKSLKNVENTISAQSSDSVLINQLQCDYLFHKLRESLNDAKACIDGSSPQDNKRSCCILESLAQTWKEGEILVGDCCDAQWIRVAMILANAKEHFTFLIFKLRLYMQLFQSIFKEGATKEFLIKLQDRKWSDDVKDEEFPIIDEKALEDQQRLLSRLMEVGSIDSENLIKRLNHPGKIDAWKVAHKSIQRVPRGQIGKGASAIVHEVEWLGKHFAEKCFFGPEGEHFQKEASLLAGLSHPNILPLFCLVTTANSCSFVTELMDGDLYGLMRKRLHNHEIQGAPFKLLEAIDIMLQVAEGMHYLHQKKVVHRDLKSTNILVKCDEHDGHVYAKVADFGLSKTKESSCTYSNLTMDQGTTRWMAPELFGNFDQSVPIQVCQETQHPSLSNEQISRRYPFKVDIYSFGMVCYEILTGNIPFHNINSMTEFRTKIKDGLRPDLPEQCPHQLSKLIQECYHPDPATRPSFFEICLELRHIMCSLMIGCTL
ncbi:unnamed protein product [Sphagnum jensenii]